MKTATKRGSLLRNSSALAALSAAAIVGSATPSVAAGPIVQGIYGGGSTLASEVLRQLFDCYMGNLVGGDGYFFVPGNHLAPGKLPATCTAATQATAVQGIYAAVGNGQGAAAYIADDPQQLMLAPAPPPPPPANFPFPETPPPFVDSNNAANFGVYPYPRMDFGAGDSPLPGGGASKLADLTAVAYGGFAPAPPWINLPTMPANAVNVANNGVVNYDAAAWGNPIQIPLLEAPVAIIVDTTNPNIAGLTWNIKSGNATTTTAGGAIALSIAQLCAIFSGNVTDWSSIAPIPMLLKNNVTKNQAFDDDNVQPGGGFGVPMSTAVTCRSRSSSVRTPAARASSSPTC